MEKWGGMEKWREWKVAGMERGGNGKGWGMEKGTEMERGAGMERGEGGALFSPKTGQKAKKHGAALSAV